MKLRDLTVSDAAACLRDGDASAEDYAEALLARCEDTRALNAFVAIEGERLLERARTADEERRRGAPLGRLHGVPLAVKDNFDVAGTPTTACTPALRDHLPAKTAPLLSRLFDEGALFLGKTTMDELACNITGDNAFVGPVRNPYDPAKSPGGSSAGTGAALAARMAPAGLGSDTSGSIRIPAAHCGLVGYRPSTGRYPSGGMVPMNHTRDAPGLLARSVGDIALLDEVITGDRALSPRPLQGVRIGIPRDFFFAELDERIAACIEGELARWRALGAELVDAEAPDFAAACARAMGPIMTYEMPRDVQRYLRDAGSGLSFEEVVAAVASPSIKGDLEAMAALDSAALERRYREALCEILPEHRNHYLRYLEDHDLAAIAFPTTPIGPAPVGCNETTVVKGKEVSVWQTLRNAVPATLVGAPGLSVPIGMTDDELPVGLELDGAPGRDRELLALGLAFAQTTGPFRPPRL